MDSKVALVGNPNCGKTTLFNALTGANQYVGNWPGATVEKKEGKLRGTNDVTIVDLPGIYSLSPYTLEEVVARDFLTGGEPSAVLNILDGSNLERNLYLTTQIIELGIPMLVVVNMMDIVRKKGDTLSAEALSRELGCEVLEMSALKNEGIDQVMDRMVAIARKGKTAKRVHAFSPEVENALELIERKLGDRVPEISKRFFAVKLFDRDMKVLARLNDVDVEEAIVQVEKSQNDDAESIMVNERYAYITSIMDGCCKRGKERVNISDRIDSVVTNRFLAIPIFVVVMFLVYFISVTTVGGFATNWANDGVFGDGWFLGSGQTEYTEASEDYDGAQAIIEAYEAAGAEAGLDPESADFADRAEASGLTAAVESYDDETGDDEVAEADYAAYAEAQDVAEPDPAEYGLWVPGIPTLVGDAMDAGDVDPAVQSLVLDGIIGGVGAVLGFVPQLIVLFILLALLEACGYMSRIAFILDRVFRRFGLSGKSFVPMLIGTGCGVPGIMASRTIENDNDRRMTVMTTTFMPCSAKLPIIALFAGAVFGGTWWVAPSAYFLGIAAILCSGVILKKTRPFAGNVAPFVMELPAYHLPTFSGVMRSMWERTSAFIKKAGTVILVACILIWAISNFGFVDGSFGWVEDQNDSLLAIIGSAICWAFAPLGWADWQAASATITGLIAKENVVGTFGVLYGGSGSWFANVQAAYTPLVAYSFLAFNLLCAPCFAAMGAIRREMNSAKWFWAAVGYECGLAYCVSLCIFQIGGLITGEAPFGVFTVVAFALVVAFLFLLFRPAPHEEGAPVRFSVDAAETA